MTQTARPPTIPVSLWHWEVTELGDAPTKKVAVPKMVLPEELRPVPVFPNRTILKGSAPDGARFKMSHVSASHRTKANPFGQSHTSVTFLVHHLIVCYTLMDSVKSDM